MPKVRSRKRASREAMIREFQQSIDATVVLLVELRSTRGISKKHVASVNTLIGELQTASRTLPELVIKNGSISMVFGPIQKTIDLMRDIFRG